MRIAFAEVVGVGSLFLAAVGASEGAPPASPFPECGYYITFMRMPTYDLADWKQMLRITRWVLGQSEGENQTLLEPASSGSPPARQTQRRS